MLSAEFFLFSIEKKKNLVSLEDRSLRKKGVMEGQFTSVLGVWAAITWGTS